jgi:ribosomal protein S18 acetylase RimI-like enzyme
LPTGDSVGKAEVSYDTQPDTGEIGSMSMREVWQSLGIGSLLIGAAEQRIRDRCLRRAALDVEENNPRARALYERLGYVAYDRRPDAWDQQAPDGTIYRYETICTLMRKDLP